MAAYVQKKPARLPVVLVDPTNNPITGMTYASVTMSFIKADGTSGSLVSGTFAEVTGGAYAGQGYYNLLASGTYTDVVGLFQYCVKSSASVPYFGVIEIISTGTNSDLTPVLKVLGKPVKTIAEDIKQTAAIVNGVASKI